MTTKGKIRVIGGKWKRSLLDVLDVEGLRPTGSRQRETLFAWLTNYFGTFEDKKALDLFSGSGALSFEWMSRGGASALLIEKNPAVARHIQKNIQKVHAEDDTHVVIGDAFAQLGALKENSPFDMVFIDPPFKLDLQLKAARLIRPYLATDGIVYIESPTEIEESKLIRTGLTAFKRGKAGFSHMLLAKPIESI
ncbi:MAG: 16S rRNA (guanine(966)-N(2))-methyltransferase RsmD [Burkholderiales bacterium]|nr:16S rRNA (guanine(966)-N(2))-methyltransferase RsmD [Burkholderiales bacterium]